MKNLENLEVMELQSDELAKIEGGWWWFSTDVFIHDMFMPRELDEYFVTSA